MVGPIVTSCLLMDLADVAHREGLFTHDPWGEPPYYPEDAGRAVTLRLDGSIVREVEIDVIPWRDVAAFRFETPLGVALDPDDVDYWD